MGDIADFMLEQDDYDGDNLQQDESEDGLNAPARKACQYCGQGSFLWKMTETGWRLYDPATGKVHSCRKGGTHDNG